MGGSKLRDVPENIVMLCRPHHEERTLNKWSDQIRVTPIGRFYLQIFGDDAKAYPLPASSPVAEPSVDDLPRGIAGSATEPGAPGHGTPGTATTGRAVGTPTVAPGIRPSPLTFRANGIEFEPEITFADWREGCERVKSESQGRQWRVGDLVNAGEGRWEEAHQYLDELGYPQETQANYANVAKAFAIKDRRPLPFTFHQTVYKLPSSDRTLWLDRALAGGWTREELREYACGPRAPRATKLSMRDLRQSLAEFEAPRELRNQGRRWAEAWLEWLEHRDGQTERTG